MEENGRKPVFSIKKAHKAQLRLSEKILFEDVLPDRIRLVAGVDVAYVCGVCAGAIAVLDFDSLKLVESQVAIYKVSFPYIPTLLSFREIPPTVLCIRKLQTQPDVFLVDGHGYAHPYRCGFASHLGLIIGKPTVGVAKSKLVGEVEYARADMDTAFVKHHDEIIGAAVTTRHRSKPVYVSTGHMVSLETAIKIVKRCVHKNRIPEPILRAHEAAETEKRKINILSDTKTVLS
jgi:deoxyribonuclease V